MKNGYYTSGEFAKMAHITIRTVRFYDKQNVLKPSFVNESGARFYTEQDFAKLQQILLLKYLGFSLEDIRNIMVAKQDKALLKDSLDLQLKLVKEQIAKMQQVQAAIEDTKVALDDNKEIDWTQMLNLIHLTNMEQSLQTQYQNATNISARIRLHQMFSKNSKGWFPFVFEQCELKENQKILELGCGSGAFWRENYNRLPKDCKIILNDISEGMLRDTKEMIEQLSLRDTDKHKMSHTILSDSNEERVSKGALFDWQAFNCEQIPFEDNSFDVVLANHVLFYCDNVDNALKEIARVLKPRGKLIASTYGKLHMQEVTELVKSFNQSISLSANNLFDKFGLDNGEELLKEYFDEIKLKLYDDALNVTDAKLLVEYIMSCHGNQNQYILDRYKEFKDYVKKQVKDGFYITKDAGVFVCTISDKNKYS